MALSVVSPPAVEPLTAEDPVLRQHLQLEGDEIEQNALVSAMCAAARGHVEDYTRRRLITQTVRLTLDGFGDGYDAPVVLPVAPIQSVDQVQYVDGTGTLQTVSSADYSLQTSREPHCLRPAYGKSWPVPRVHTDVVRIDLVVGYGAAGSDVPAAMVQAARLLVAHMFQHREAALARESVQEIPMGVRDLLNPFRIWL